LVNEPKKYAHLVVNDTVSGINETSNFTHEYLNGTNNSTVDSDEDYWWNMLLETIDFAFHIFINYFFPTEIQRIQSELTLAKEELEKFDQEIQIIQEFLSVDCGLDNLYCSFYEKVYQTESHHYNYELHFFRTVYQKVDTHYVLLGKWKKWESDYNVMIYDEGEKCWEGPNRSANVTLLCGVSEEISNVKEPSKCEYVMDFYTPAACFPGGLKKLEEELKHFEL